MNLIWINNCAENAAMQGLKVLTSLPIADVDAQASSGLHEAAIGSALEGEADMAFCTANVRF